MTEREKKQLVVIDFLRQFINDNNWKVKAEYNTNDNNISVVVVQEQAGPRIVFYGECDPLYNYYMIDLYDNNIQEAKSLSVKLQYLIGTNNYIKKDGNTWQILIKQFTNFQPIEYLDIKRVGYNATMQCIVSKIKEGD